MLHKEWTVVEMHKSGSMINKGTFTDYYKAVGVAYDSLLDINDEDPNVEFAVGFPRFTDDGNKIFLLMRLENDEWSVDDRFKVVLLERKEKRFAY